MTAPLTKIVGLLAILATGVDWDDAAMKPERDYGRTCLALVGFSEARDQNDEGLAAVMQVVVNRATDHSRRWPSTLCGAALEPGQFLGVDNWPMPRHPERIDASAWARALDMADRVIAREAPVPASCAVATGFDQNHAVTQPDIVCRVGAHTFYAEPPLSTAAN
jgi:spore germination cell wall hydrolase CwlJ-like protein